MSKVSISSIIQDCTALALNSLSKGDLANCENLLNKATDLLKSSDPIENKLKLQRSIWESFGVLYKLSEDFGKAQEFLEKAYENSEDLSSESCLELLLNLCGVYFKNRCFEKLIKSGEVVLSVSGKTEETSIQGKALGYYYIACGLQGTKRVREAANFFQIALKEANDTLGFSHPISGMIMKQLLKAQKKNRSKIVSTKTEIKSAMQSYEKPSNSKIAIKASEKTESHSKIVPSIAIPLSILSTSKNRPKPSTGSKIKLYSKDPCPSARTHSKNTTRTSTSYSQKPQDCILPKISQNGRSKVTSSLDLPVNSRFSEKPITISTPKASIFSSEELNTDYTSPMKGKGPPGTGRVKVRRLSADYTLPGSALEERSVIRKNKKYPSLSQVVLIQKWVRGLLGRLRVKRIKRAAANKRGQKALHELSRLKEKMLVLKHIENIDIYNIDYLEKEVRVKVYEYIVRIQRCVRMAIARKRFQKVRKCVIKIQSIARMFIVRSLFEKIVMAIKFIQDWWRRVR